MLPNINRLSLGFFPTPVHSLTRLSSALGGPQILIKRDDQTGLGLGGNKTRKLEFILADAIERGSDCIVTAGAQQSNHCRQTAAACAQLGLECHLLLGGNKPPVLQGNLILDTLLGAHLHWCGDHRKGEDIPEVMAELQGSGKRPYLVPYGGSNVEGALSFVAALEELQSQIEAQGVTHIVFASSSGATHAGLVVGNHLMNLGLEIIGINIEKERPGEQSLRRHIEDLIDATLERLGGDTSVPAEDIVLEDNYSGGGYGVLGEADREAISTVAEKEGLLLDPVYTGRAMAGLIDKVRKGYFSPEHKVLFWHTGGAPALFAYQDTLFD